MATTLTSGNSINNHYPSETTFGDGDGTIGADDVRAAREAPRKNLDAFRIGDYAVVKALELQTVYVPAQLGHLAVAS